MVGGSACACAMQAAVAIKSGCVWRCARFQCSKSCQSVAALASGKKFIVQMRVGSASSGKGMKVNGARVVVHGRGIGGKCGLFFAKTRHGRILFASFRTALASTRSRCAEHRRQLAWQALLDCFLRIRGVKDAWVLR